MYGTLASVQTTKTAVVCLSSTPGLVRYCEAVCSVTKHCGKVLVLCSEHAEFRWKDPDVEYVGVCGARSPRAELANLNVGRLWQAVRLLREASPCVVHFVCTHPWNALLMHESSGRKVMTLHDPVAHPGERYSRLTNLLNQYLAGRADAVIVHGRRFLDYLQTRGFDPSRVHYMELPPHHQPTPVFARITGAPSALFFGRLRPYKGAELFLKAAAKVVHVVPESRFVIAGEGQLPPISDFSDLRDRLSVINRAVREEEIPILFNGAWVVVLPYRSATQSGVITLARAYGRPVIVTNVGALPEVVQDGIDGFIVPPENAEALADRMAVLLSDRSMAERMGQASWRRGLDSAARWGAALLRVYGFVDRDG